MRMVATLKLYTLFYLTAFEREKHLLNTPSGNLYTR